MARKNEDGRFIIAAGEVAQYALCPEAWRLAIVQRKPRQNQIDRTRKGDSLHVEWANRFWNATSLAHSLRILLLLLLLSLALQLL